MIRVIYEYAADSRRDENGQWVDCYGIYVSRGHPDLDAQYPNECEWIVPGTINE